MRPLSLGAWGCAVAAMIAVGTPAQAAWNNVFQVCCNTCGTPAPVVAAYPDPCPAPCPAPCPPPPVCTTRYVQRTYYQPVTCYKPQTYTEAVTTYQTRYYSEPVTTYRYSCAYNPCTCRYESVAQPVTCYRTRAQCCPVTSYLQRTCMVPVTVQRPVTYYEAVTSCCTPTSTPAAAPPAGAPGGTESRDPASSLPPPPPESRETREPTPAGTDSTRDRSPGYTPPGTMPRTESGFRGTPGVRFDRIASTGGSNVEGRLVDDARLPRSGARVLFVSVEEKRTQFEATTTADGVFRAKLPSGGWLVYTFDAKGKPVFSRRVEVPAGKGVNFTLVSR